MNTLAKWTGIQIKILNLLCIFYSCLIFTVTASQITPYKFTDKEIECGGPQYHIPPSSRFIVKGATADAAGIIYYYSPPYSENSSTANAPHRNNFPIVIVCGGSSLENYIVSAIHLHRFYLKEFGDLGIGIVTVEQQGVNGNQIDKHVFMDNYTRSKRLADHRMVIEHLKKHPPKGWNGKLIFFGGSEGGLLVTTLTTDYPDMVLATINWSGAAGLPLAHELWCFLQYAFQDISWYTKLRFQLPLWIPFPTNLIIPTSYEDYDKIIHQIIENPMIMLTYAFVWEDKIWCFLQNTVQHMPWYMNFRSQQSLYLWMPFVINLWDSMPYEDYDKIIHEMIKNPTTMLQFSGMTYKFWADALQTYPNPEYAKIKTPFLVVAGAKDVNIDSTDVFVQYAKEANAPITYMRIPDMGHAVRQRLDVVQDSFLWLKKQLLDQDKL